MLAIRNRFPLAAAALVLGTGAHGTTYRVTDLGSLVSSDDDQAATAQAYAMNDLGHVVGVAETDSGSSRPFIWKSGAGMVELPTPSGIVNVTVTDINDAGRVVGYGTNANGDLQPVTWSTAGDFIAVTTYPEAPCGRLVAISDTGHAVGSVYLSCFGGSADDQSGIWWTYQDGIDLDAGDQAGSQWMNISPSGIYAIGWQAPRMLFWYSVVTGEWDGAPIPPPVGSSGFSIVDVNDSGWVAGMTSIGGTAFVYVNLGAQGTLLAPSLGGDWIIPMAIGPSGSVVGSANTTSGSSAFATSPVWLGGIGGPEIYAMHDLNDRIPAGTNWHLYAALDINASGQIVGHGYRDGTLRAFLLTPEGATSGTEPDTCPGDADGDGSIGFGDLTALLADWGACD